MRDTKVGSYRGVGMAGQNGWHDHVVHEDGAIPALHPAEPYSRPPKTQSKRMVTSGHPRGAGHQYSRANGRKRDTGG